MIEINNLGAIKTILNFSPETCHILHISQRAKDHKIEEWSYGTNRNVILEVMAFHSFKELEADMDRIKSICWEKNARAYITCEEFKILREDWKDFLSNVGGLFQHTGLQVVPPLFQLYDWDKGQDRIDERVSEWMIEKGYQRGIVPTVTGQSIICCDFDDCPSFLPEQIFISRLKKKPLYTSLLWTLIHH